jgi:D-alanyl-D-alanine carboxypeptidase
LEMMQSKTIDSRPSTARLMQVMLFVLVLAAATGWQLTNTAPAHANSKYAAVVIDGHSGRIVYARSADRPRYPASLTKVMTLYLLFEELEAGRVNMSTRLQVSPRAAGQPPSKLGVRAGTTITVDQAIRALVTKSANDVAVVVAEHISGSEYRFAQRMTTRARSLGMRRTRFMNASGLPNNRQLTTARDMATLAQRMQKDFPDFYGFFSLTEFRYNGRRYTNHNSLVGRYSGTTGLKTGYTRASGFNLTATVEREGKYLIGVVLGGQSARSRDDHMVSILDRAWGTAIAMNNPRTRLASTPLPRTRPGATPTRYVLASAVSTPLPAPPPQGDTSLDVSFSDTSGSETVAVNNLRSTTSTGESDVFNPSSWVIQVGAYAQPSEAVARIRQAVRIAPVLLANAVPITMPVSSEAQTLYRSRFGGLNESNARKACRELTRASISCIAIPPHGWGRTASANG